MANPTLSMIDPTKQAEYPIVLGERLRNPNTSRLINVNYNHKSKSATSQQRSVITHSRSSDLYDLTVTDKAPNADQTLTYSYKGSEDSSSDRSLVLIFDPDRKVFVLEPVSTTLNFNLRSAPGKTEKQVREQYEQLQIKEEDEPTSGEDRHGGSTSEDEGPADDSNPYDFRHFLPKNRREDNKPISGHSTPELAASRANTPLIPAARPAPRPAPRPTTQTNPLRQKKPPTKPPVKAHVKPSEPVSYPDPPELEDSRSPSDAGTGSQQTGQSPSSNIIVDGDLIIDMGSPPPSRPFVVNRAYFSSNNTPADEDGDEDIGEFSLPSPVGNTAPPASSAHTGTATQEDEVEDDDALAAEMEAAFEQSAREEEARSHHYTQPTTRQYIPSDDESEVSEEE
ncbi:hypothetical protein N7491_004799 [Penicillium cf. griseofulvum]|uniref:Transcription elongation factor Eaf N-terminal domain-containing protein n=1 Tax=Penicillium cf. griseofulvum TaxID=2972120 RepID=A0A9W9J535_9EURO|nr:hypothetical protein N7472_007489 [Penicillium cf. griseofulvum]KAJ5434204.1 hypothetical protein N7491_004799 [Penicillium cf. griseofulvum]KAJ5452029.1 hypothetical protein N7445_000212 [Penicillium cf. griseofulvum]